MSTNWRVTLRWPKIGGGGGIATKKTLGEPLSPLSSLPDSLKLVLTNGGGTQAGGIGLDKYEFAK